MVKCCLARSTQRPNTYGPAMERGVGLRLGRRHPDQLIVGETVDFWRVEPRSSG
ncbi:unannotated protein [freshwater metagenome]|uniref:Unannotated protein n=2 Tax=freshwater metagenome TaxID=449393 RepID=A0A6J7ARS1_9ZZZZ